MKQKRAKEGLGFLCGLFGYTRQAYYQQLTRNAHQAIKEEIVIERVKEKRKNMPKLGGRKLNILLEKDGIHIGRDKLFDLLRNNHMLVVKKKHKIYTTQSKHWMKKYPNLIEGMEVIKPNKLWVSDITYILVDNKDGFLFLITDAYSHKIMGYFVSESLEAEGGLIALRMALNEVDWQNRAGLIHHSDRGAQYCCHKYVNLLQTNKMLISMTQHGDPYENALAERMNGILKEEWIHNERFRDIEHAGERIAEIIKIYNTERPHSSCNMMTPEQAHQCNGKLKKHWKNYYHKVNVEK